MHSQDGRYLLPTEYPLKQSIRIYWNRFLLILTVAFGNLVALLAFVLFQNMIGIVILLLLAGLVFLVLFRSRIHAKILDRYRLRLINLRAYWRIRAALHTVEFHRTRIILGLKERLFGMRSVVPILVQLVFLSAKASILGFALASATLLAAYYNQDGTYLWLLGNIAATSESSYEAALIAIITVTGVVLTLYFSNLNTLIGSLYSELPERIRALMLEDRPTNVSIKFLTSLTIFSLTTLAGGTLHDLRPNVALLFAIAWTILAIPTLALLAKRTFAFFNPTYLADAIVRNLYKITNDVTIQADLALDPSFQEYNMKLASEACTSLGILASIAVANEDLRRDALTKLLTKTNVVLEWYLRRKPGIPIQSRWYRRVPEHKDWYLASSHEVTLAISTHTDLQPNMKPDYVWFEESCMSQLVESFERLLESSEYSTAGGVLLISAIACESLGAGYDVVSSSRTIRRVHKQFVESLESEHDTEPLLLLQTLNYVNLLPIRTLLGFFSIIGEIGSLFDLGAHRTYTMEF